MIFGANKVCVGLCGPCSFLGCGGCERLSGYFAPLNAKTRRLCDEFYFWLRGQDLNLRPSGYEPDELPGCSTPRYGCDIMTGFGIFGALGVIWSVLHGFEKMD